jgi:exopolyphosphatase/guanosine-5'-triphosphate,3'-diphosphate pyrophosphatase
VAQARAAAAAAGCEELLAFATSALRDADNSAAVLERVHDETGVRLQVLPGEDEARYTFLAVRRWYGWSAGQLLVLDIGGGSLELAAGRDEDPEVAVSLPLGAGRLTRERLSGDPPARAQIDSLAEELDAVVALAARQVRKLGQFDVVVGTSKTFRSLARLAGAAPSSAGVACPPDLDRRRTASGVRVHQPDSVGRPSLNWRAWARDELISWWQACRWPRRRCARCGSANYTSAPGHYAKA